MNENAWKRGMQRLRPGLYVDSRGALQIDSAEFLQSEGYPVTPENEAMLRKALPDVLDVLADATIEDV